MDLRLWQARFRDYLLIVKQWSPATADLYGAELKHLFAFLEERGVTNLANLSRSQLEEYRTHLFYLKSRGKSLSLSTQSVRFAAVKAFARFLFRENYLLLDIARDLEKSKRPKRLPRVLLSESEVVRLLEAPNLKSATGLRDRAACPVGNCT